MPVITRTGGQVREPLSLIKGILSRRRAHNILVVWNHTYAHQRPIKRRALPMPYLTSRYRGRLGNYRATTTPGVTTRTIPLTLPCQTRLPERRDKQL